MTTVHFTFQTAIQDKTFYVTYGSMNCIKSKKVPESFSAMSSPSGKAQANNDGSCAYENSKIKLYIWADPDHTDQVAKIKLWEDITEEHPFWDYDFQYFGQGYYVTLQPSDDVDYLFDLVG
ncbi:MAG: hypothetical protein AAGM22_22910 [Acidobacteriota bacterium]